MSNINKDALMKLLAGLNASQSTNQTLGELVSDQQNYITELEGKLQGTTTAPAQEDFSFTPEEETEQEQETAGPSNLGDILQQMFSGQAQPETGCGGECSCDEQETPKVDLLSENTDFTGLIEQLASIFSGQVNAKAGVTAKQPWGAQSFWNAPSAPIVEPVKATSPTTSPVNLVQEIDGLIGGHPMHLAIDELADAIDGSTFFISALNGQALFVKDNGEVRDSTQAEWTQYHTKA